MQTFSDSSGNTWKINLSFGEIIRVRNASDGEFDLLYPESKTEGGEELQARLADDYGLFWELLYFICEPQLLTAYADQIKAACSQPAEGDKPTTARQICAELFGQAMAANCVVDAHKAFFREWVSFFHRLNQPQQAMVIEKTAKLRELAQQAVAEKMNTPEIQELEARAAKKIQSAVNSSFTTLADSLESLLSVEPGGNSN